MNGDQLFIDTNIILYYLNGDRTLLPVLEDKQLFVSFITQLELLSFNLHNSSLLQDIDFMQVNPDLEKVRFWERSEAKP
jgi:predicted nucleic acid-binding protein